METIIETPATETSPAQLFEKAASLVVKESRHRGAKSKFKAHIDTIRSLRCRKSSYAQIHRFLNENGVKCSYIGLVSFCRMNFKS